MVLRSGYTVNLFLGRPTTPRRTDAFFTVVNIPRTCPVRQWAIWPIPIGDGPWYSVLVPHERSLPDPLKVGVIHRFIHRTGVRSDTDVDLSTGYPQLIHREDGRPLSDTVGRMSGRSVDFRLTSGRLGFTTSQPPRASYALSAFVLESKRVIDERTV